jgi:hypothetical protein
MTPPIISPDQLDLLAWEPPETVARFDDRVIRAATIAGQISHAVAAALRDADDRGLYRDEVARRMGAYLGERVSVPMLNGYASEAREQNVISVPRLLALVHVTGDRRLLQMLAEPFGWAVIEGRHLPLIEIAAIREREDELRRRADALRRQVGRRI